MKVLRALRLVLPQHQASSTFKVDVVNGLRNVGITLDARSYRSPSFATQLVSLLVALRVPVWSTAQVDPTSLSIRKVSGSLTNAVYFVSYPPSSPVPTLLLRIYGSSSGSLISRSHELHTLHILSSRYHIGPRIYGTFSNGRIEEYFDSVTLGPTDLRDNTISRWIGARMAELHSVELSAVEGPLTISSLEGKSWEIGVKKNVKTWLPIAREVLAHPNVDESDRLALSLDIFCEKWARYMRWVSHAEKTEGASRRVFAHNDAQYGNLLRLTGKLAEGTPEHRQIVVVDFEYASPNPLAFDVANHFHEWTSDYFSSTPHLLDPSRYPTAEQRRNFYQAYLLHAHAPSSDHSTTEVVSEASLAKLEQQVRVWSPASHAMWAVWGIVQAKDNVEMGMGEAEFDYIGYSKCRMQAFLRGIDELGI
ncbi:choline kinase cytoplasm [Melanogaster broomeanus]|nr:choline kinase cytoplasm [Melanogaster broomeanus]